jgi:hypothetical protein
VVAGVTAYGTSKWQATQDYQQQFPQGATAGHVMAADFAPVPTIDLVVGG